MTTHNPGDTYVKKRKPVVTTRAHQLKKLRLDPFEDVSNNPKDGRRFPKRVRTRVKNFQLYTFEWKIHLRSSSIM